MPRGDFAKALAIHRKQGGTLKRAEFGKSQEYQVIKAQQQKEKMINISEVV